MDIKLSPTGEAGGAEVAKEPISFESSGSEGSAPSAGGEVSSERREPVPSSGGDTSSPAGGAESTWESIREAAQRQGYTFGPDVQDDQTALGQLLRDAQASRQESVYAQLGRQLAPHADAVREWVQTQKTQGQAPGPKSWEPPAYDRRWAGLVDFDPQTGMAVGKPGTPATIVDAVNQRLEWQQKWDANPAGMLEGLIEERSASQARKIFEEMYAQRQGTDTAHRIIQENSAWLYQQDDAGQYTVGYDGNPVLTPMGQTYMGYLRVLSESGVKQPEMLNHLARQLTGAYYAVQQQSSAAGGVPGPTRASGAGRPNPQTRQARGAPNRNAAGAQPPSVREHDTAATEPVIGRGEHRLAAALRRGFSEEGVTNDDIRASVESRDGGADRGTGYGLGT